MIRLSRRDRAALALAYEELRGGTIGYASACQALRHTDGCDALPYLPPLLADAEAAMDDAIAEPVGSRAWNSVHYRNRDMLRARLALLLRAILRADAGDFGPRRCGACGVSLTEDQIADGWHRACRGGGRGASYVLAPFTPLWGAGKGRGA